MEKHNCPIDGKSGLPDYRLNHVICPQCDTDLKAFMLINEISKSEETATLNLSFAKRKHLKFRTLLIIVSICLGFCFAISAFIYNKKVMEYDVSLANNVQLNDTISLLKKKLVEIPVSPVVPDYFEYTVKHGDSFSKLAYLFYGSGKPQNSEIIAEFNNMKTSDLLQPGTKLNIKNKIK